MKNFIERYKNLPWYAKILVIPGVVFAIPIIMLYYMTSYTCDVLGLQ